MFLIFWIETLMVDGISGVAAWQVRPFPVNAFRFYEHRIACLTNLPAFKT